jgi:PAS domain S-box-containing protein
MLPGMLKAEEDQFHLLAEMIPQIVWIRNNDGSMEYINQRWYEYTHAPSGEATNDETWLHYCHPDDFSQVAERWFLARTMHQPYEVEFRLLDQQTRTYRWFLTQATPLMDEQGQILKWFGTCTDIDERKRSEEKQVDKYLKFSRHELKTPLADIKLITQYLARKLKKGKLEDIENYLTQITSQVDHCTEMVNDLLHPSKLRTEQTKEKS